MKKIIALILALICAFPFTLSVTALSITGGVEPLKAEFVAGEGPVEGKYSIDYSYFSPVKENDKTKYPLVAWLHGMGDGSEVGKPVQKSNVAYWASDDFQARFEPAGGAFILAARSREENGQFWSDAMTAPLRAAIDDFIAKNKDNIDLTRIYVGGYSMGGKMALIMATRYTGFFAATFLMSPVYAPSNSELDALAETPTWLMVCKNDNYI
jgi:predicted peptidase